MSIQAIAQVLSHSKAKGTEKLVLVVLANRINPETGICWPSIRLIAQEVGVSERQVQRYLHDLVEKGELIVTLRKEASNLYRLPDVMSQMSPPPSSVSPVTYMTPPGDMDVTTPGDMDDTTPGDMDDTTPVTLVSPRNESIKQKNETKINRKERATAVAVVPTPRAIIPRGNGHDPRTDHPAIQAIKSITGRNPPMATYGLVIDKLGDEPDTQRLREIFTSWVARGYKPTNLAGILEWYAAGVPDEKRPGFVGYVKPRRNAFLRKMAGEE